MMNAYETSREIIGVMEYSRITCADVAILNNLYAHYIRNGWNVYAAAGDTVIFARKIK